MQISNKASSANYVQASSYSYPNLKNPLKITVKLNDESLVSKLSLENAKKNENGEYIILKHKISRMRVTVENSYDNSFFETLAKLLDVELPPNKMAYFLESLSCVTCNMKLLVDGFNAYIPYLELEQNIVFDPRYQ